MAKLEIPVVVNIDAVTELIEEIKKLQTYKLGMGDKLILVDRDAVVKIFADHVKADLEECKTGRWIEETVFRNSTRYNYHCSECGNDSLKKYSFCPNCGARMIGGDGV